MFEHVSTHIRRGVCSKREMRHWLTKVCRTLFVTQKLLNLMVDQLSYLHQLPTDKCSQRVSFPYHLYRHLPLTIIVICDFAEHPCPRTACTLTFLVNEVSTISIYVYDLS